MVKQIENLFDQIKDYERGDPSFQEKNFTQAFQGVLEYFQLVSDDFEKVKTADESLLRAAQSAQLERSTLRYLTVHILTTIFDYVASAKTRSEAYRYCRHLRKNQKDSVFFARELAPKLFEPGGLRGNILIRYLFMYQTCMLQEVSGDPNPLRDDLPPGELRRVNPHSLILGLFRRMLKAGSPGLINQKGTLEYKMAKTDFLPELAESNPVHSLLLQEWGYVEKEASLWARFRSSFGRRMRALGGSLGSLRFLLHLLTQRTGAYLVLVIVIFAFLFLALWVPKTWMGYRGRKMERFTKWAQEVEVW